MAISSRVVVTADNSFEWQHDTIDRLVKFYEGHHELDVGDVQAVMWRYNIPSEYRMAASPQYTDGLGIKTFSNSFPHRHCDLGWRSVTKLN